jgi:hypothetical protein
MDRQARALRRPAVALALLALAGVLPVAVPGLTPDATAAPVCVAPSYPLSTRGEPDVCVHADRPPSGVDVRARPTTKQLRARKGAGAKAFFAAQELGVPGSYATTATSSAVPCDGDGTSGARVQAMYVVESTRANRYTDLLPSFRLWAAGVDDVLNRTAALTGGVRNVRYVTDPGANGTCVARVLNVTVPAGSMLSFGTTVQAVQALGYTNPARKYLMWTDATSLCGVATMYLDDKPDQSNLNNGGYAQYARIDSGCWGWGNGTNQHSVEAHELTHALGGVQYSAAHSTRAGHCWDESDTMCYADGGSHAMVSVCPAEREYLLDCNSDDYYSTFPPAGGYLDTHWNAADSRFLIGGGDGTSGGSLGTPTSLGGTLSVNNPAVPGLATQASVAPELPPGRTLTSVGWRAGRSDCAIAPNGDGTQASVTCPVTATTPTSVTAVLTDSTGATKTLTSPLTFQTTGTKRAVQVALTVQGRRPSATVCSGLGTPVEATVLDALTGVPVKGLTASFTKRAATSLYPSVVALRLTGSDGAAAASLGTTTAVTYAATTAAAGVFLAGSASGVAVTPVQCTGILAAATSTTSAWYGDTVTVTGTLRRTVSTTADTPVPNVYLTATVKAPDAVSSTGALVVGRTTTVASLRTAADGTFRGTFRATRSGTVRVLLPATPAFAATSVDLGALAVTLPTTTLTAGADGTDVGYGGTVTVRGTLLRNAAATTPLAGSYVTVRLTAPGRTPVALATGRVATDGSFAVPAAVRSAGVLDVAYAGAAGQPAAAAVAGPVTVGTWTPALTLALSASSVPLGGYAVVTGTVTRSYAGVTEPARSVLVRLYLAPSSGAAPLLLTSVYSMSTGAFSTRIYPRSSGTLTAVVQPVTGYAGASSAPLSLTVG